MPKQGRFRHRESRPYYDTLVDDVTEDDGIKPTVPSQVISAIKEVKPRHQAIEEQFSDKKSVARNKRMLGMILGTLQKFQSEESKRKPSTQRRAEIEEKLDKIAEEEKANLKKERRELAKKKREEQAQLRKEELKSERLTIHEEWEMSHKHLGNFIQTKTKPHIFYFPVESTPESEKRCKDTKEKFKWVLAERRAKIQKELNDIEDLYKKEELGDDSNDANKDENNIEDNEDSTDGKTEAMEEQGNINADTGEVDLNKGRVKNEIRLDINMESNEDHDGTSRVGPNSEDLAEREFEPIYDD